MTMSLRRPGIASPALAVLAALALRRALFCFRARAFLPDIALEEWVVLCARRGLCVVASEKSVTSTKGRISLKKESEKCNRLYKLFNTRRAYANTSRSSSPALNSWPRYI